MPELPEVQTVVSGLQKYVGQTLQEIHIIDDKVWYDSQLASRTFAGQKLERIFRIGKYIIYAFANGAALLQHLRMTGKMLPIESVAIPEKIKQSKPRSKQLRLSLRFPSGELYFYDTRRFGTFTAVKDLEEYFAHKGHAPDLYIDFEKAKKWFQERIIHTDRNIKAVLLDQTFISGVGNIYADEVLHVLGIHPEMPVKKLTPIYVDKLFKELKKIFDKSIAARGTTANDYVDAEGQKGDYGQALQVYGREGEVCRRCGVEKIRRLQVAGRSSHICPRCQKRTLPRD
jgi:formamidopyrimidine-DNA glycosylase